MKLKLFFLTALLFAVYTESSARARVPYCSDCQYIQPVADLPDSAQFYSEEYKAYADVAYVYKQFWIIWVPLWNFDGHYCLSIKDKDVYFDIDDEALKSYQASYNLDLPSNPIPLWDKFGGKAIVLLLAAGAIWAYRGKDSDDEEEAPEEVTAGKIAGQK
jgi:hypothetical protein